MSQSRFLRLPKSAFILQGDHVFADGEWQLADAWKWRGRVGGTFSNRRYRRPLNNEARETIPQPSPVTTVWSLPVNNK